LHSCKESPYGINADLLKVLLDLNSFSEEIKGNFSIKNQETPKEKQKVITLVLFIRILEIVQSTLILAIHGVREDLNSMFRIFLDAYFVFANFCLNVNFTKSYFLTDEKNRLTLMNVASKHESDLFKKLNEYATSEIRNDLDRKVKEQKIQSFKSSLYAEKAGCSEIYDSMYRLTSASIHTTPRCLEHYVETDKDGNIIIIKHKSDPETSNRVIYDISYHHIKVLRGICELFELNKESKLIQFQEDLKKSV
jgi:hypothetical protein